MDNQNNFDIDKYDIIFEFKKKLKIITKNGDLK